MPEYIERDAAEKVADRYGCMNGSAIGIHSGLADCIAREIDALPSADVAPVRHGRWVHDHYENCSEQFEIVKCTNCGHKAYAMAIYVRGGNYCPNCGAKMDGDEHNERERLHGKENT
ncbi:MAG: hypothetical protein MR648_05120 [Clostridiales bacterium]|nr:hypothetical protein [Clostridiales bacterium]MDY4181006.1 hypothetical protein [Pseudoflavonifractor sp.]